MYKVRSANLYKSQIKNQLYESKYDTSNSIKNLSVLSSPCLNCEKLLIKITKNRKSFSTSPSKFIRKMNTREQKDQSTQEESDVVSPMNHFTTGIPNEAPNLMFEHVITPEEGENIKKTLKSHFLFNEITEDVLKIIL